MAAFIAIIMLIAIGPCSILIVALLFASGRCRDDHMPTCRIGGRFSNSRTHRNLN